MSVPSSSALAALQIKRFCAEALFAVREEAGADAIALDVVASAKELGIAREVDAAITLLRLHRRSEALGLLSEGDRTRPRQDELDDLVLVELALSAARHANGGT